MTTAEQTKGSREAFSFAQRRKYLRKFREQAGLSLADLGKMTKLSRSMLSLFERGERDLSAAAMARLDEAIADVLKGKYLDELRSSDAAKKLVPLKTLLRAPVIKAERQAIEEQLRQLGRQAAAEREELATEAASLEARIRQHLERENAILQEMNTNLREIVQLQGERIGKLEEAVAQLNELLQVTGRKTALEADAREKLEALDRQKPEDP